MSEAFTPLTAPEAIAAAHRIFDRADRALTIRRALDGVPDRELISIVILARQLDEIARAAGVMMSLGNSPERIRRAVADALAERLIAAGYLELPDQPQLEEPAHGEG